MMLEAFYSHPWAWNEIGFGGPAYPQGYMRLGPTGTLEPHERPGATDEDPVRAEKELGGGTMTQHPQGVPRAGRKRFSLPARRPPP